MPQRLRGVLSPVVTPFRKDYSPDAKRFVRHCKWLLAHGCSGLAVFGTNSEANSLSADERMTLLEQRLSSSTNTQSWAVLRFRFAQQKPRESDAATRSMREDGSGTVVVMVWVMVNSPVGGGGADVTLLMLSTRMKGGIGS